MGGRGRGFLGALLAGAVGTAGYEVAEAARTDARHGVGKSEALDAHRIAAAVLRSMSSTCAGHGSTTGPCASRVLVTAR